MKEFWVGKNLILVYITILGGMYNTSTSSLLYLSCTLLKFKGYKIEIVVWNNEKTNYVTITWQKSWACACACFKQVI